MEFLAFMIVHIFLFEKLPQVFRSGGPSVHCDWQCVKFPVSSHLISMCLCLPSLLYSFECVCVYVLSYCSFGLHFLDD